MTSLDFNWHLTTLHFTALHCTSLHFTSLHFTSLHFAGFYYVGPVDAHDLDNLVPILENIRDNVPDTKPVLLHIRSVKGKGYSFAEAASDKYHGVAKFDVASGKQKVTASSTPPLTTVFANALVAIAEEDRSVCAITAAMPGGTGTDKFGRRFPKRTFDVGIAEQHAVTFAAGMAVEGLKPFMAIYSTFMQRAYERERARRRVLKEPT